MASLVRAETKQPAYLAGQAVDVVFDAFGEWLRSPGIIKARAGAALALVRVIRMRLPEFTDKRPKLLGGGSIHVRTSFSRHSSGMWRAQ